MPRTVIPITDVTRTGTTQPSQTSGDASNNHYLAYNDGRVMLELTAASGTVVYTIITPGTVDGLAVSDLTVSVTTTPKVVGPLPPAVYNQADGTVNIDVDSANGRARAYRL